MIFGDQLVRQSGKERYDQYNVVLKTRTFWRHIQAGTVPMKEVLILGHSMAISQYLAGRTQAGDQSPTRSGHAACQRSIILRQA
ncbi:MAG: hypothetical protein CMQ34_10705 [Gammaproteobacteria bacterium]|nr:hypothetical protein [Gammaproteobacteria bacterium]|tara:strand:+ start:2033 stop:2284 length:252 start_codon:yes stop_codon:yes gene_type:complete